MLERVCSNVEPAAQFFLRNIELPVRSSRLLDRYFFRNEGNILDISPWWPAYLESVRKIPQASHDRSLHSPSKSRPAVALHRRSFVNSPHPPTPTRHRPRTYLVGSKNESRAFGLATYQRQQAKPVLDNENRTAEEAEDFKLAGSDTIDGLNAAKTNTIAQQPVSSEAARPDEIHADFEDVWKSFVMMNDQKSKAGQVFTVLAMSTNKTDCERAIKAFDVVSPSLRTREMYQKALDLQFKLLRHREAISLVLDGHQLGYHLAPQAMAYFVRNLLWTRAADLWRGLAHHDITTVDDISDKQHLSPRQFREECGKMVDLPSKVVNLAERLRSNDPVYAGQRTILLDLYRHLALSVVRSHLIMRSITPKGLLLMIQLSEELFKIELRPIALGTMRKMSDDLQIKGANSQLALLLYRNWRFVSPEDTISRQSLWDLTKICTRARESTEVYDYIIDEYRKMYNKPSKRVYETILLACSKQGEVDQVHRYLQNYVFDHGKPTQPRLVNALIYVYARIGDIENAKTQFNRIQSEFNLVPDTVMWNTLLLAHVRSLQPATALDVYEVMRKENVQCNEQTFGMLISLLGSLGDTDAANRLLTEAQSYGINLSRVMFESIAESYLARGDPTAAQTVIELATTQFPHQEATRGWNALLRYHAHLSDSEAILRVQSRMRELKIEPDAMTYAALMTALVSIGKTKEAAKILRTLHLSQNLYANELHYSILLQGFVKEGNRDMATLIYHEMQQRFPQLSRSAEVSYLKMLCDRDAQAVRQDRTTFPYLTSLREHAVAHLRKLTNEASCAQFASVMPQPGLGKRSQIRESISQYFEVVLESMLDDGLYEEALKLFQEYEEVSTSELNNLGIYLEPTTQMLTIKMQLESWRGHWDSVHSLWHRIFDSAKDRFRSLDRITAQNRDRKQSLETFATDKSEIWPEQRSYILESLPSTQFSFSSMIQSQERVPYQHRFNLARPMNLYMEALHATSNYKEMVDLAENLFPQAGFELNSHNWNSYIQLLSRASSEQYRLRAFSLFEAKMFPFLSSWKYLLRGKYLDRAGLDDTSSGMPVVVLRKDKLRLQPGLPIPTYYTVTFLGAALARAYRIARETGESTELDAMQLKAGKTVRFLQATPHVKDRVQGLLLRGRKVTGDFARRARSENSYRAKIIFPGGVLGSESPYDNAPPQYAKVIEEALRPENQVRDLLRGHIRQQQHQLTEHPDDDLELGEKLLGPVNRSALVLPRRARLESGKEQKMREKNEIRRRTNLIRTIRRDARRKHFFSDKYGGVPTFAFKPPLGQESVHLRQKDMDQHLKLANKTSHLRSRTSTTRDLPPLPSGESEIKLLTRRINPRLVIDSKSIVRKVISNRRKRAFSRDNARRLEQRQADSVTYKTRINDKSRAQEHDSDQLQPAGTQDDGMVMRYPLPFDPSWEH